MKIGMFRRLKSNNVALQLGGERITKTASYQWKINCLPILHLFLRGDNRRSAISWRPAGEPVQIV